MAINFPNSPTIGEEYTAGGFTWVWTGSAWEKVAEATAVANDFVLVVGSTGNTTYVLERPYSAGRYFIDFVNNDTTYDIYFVAEDGTYAGYTSTDSALVTAAFTEVVVLGATNNEIITFTYQGVSTTPSSVGDVSVAGAFINSVVTANLPNVDDTTVVNGGNFAPNVQVSFIGTNDVETAAKNVVRTSSAQLVATRPDSFTTANSPYDVKVLNPGIPAPTGSNRHILSNSVTAGTNPAWVTGSTVFYHLTEPTSITLLATDTEASDIDYTIVTGTLPAGLSLNSETGVISGTFSGSASEGDSTSMTFRATDAGGNFVDKAISLVANASPVWTTAAGALTPASIGSSYSFQLQASTGAAGGGLTYTVQSGSLPTGLTLSSSGLISGTPTSNGAFSFTVRVADQGNYFTDRAFSITASAVFNLEYLVIAGGGSGGSGHGGGGGAGGYRCSLAGEGSGRSSATESTLSITPGLNYSITIGAGGPGGKTASARGESGTGSSFSTITTVGGGPGAGYGQTGGAGGSGAGGSGGATPAAAGTANQGHDGRPGSTDGFSWGAGGGGGGANGQGTNGFGISTSNGRAGDGGPGYNSSVTGTSVGRGGGGAGGSNTGGNGTHGGGNTSTNGTVNTGGGGGGNFDGGGGSGSGGSGVVILRYPLAQNIVLGAGLTGTTNTVGANKVTVITAGTGNVSWT